MLDVAHDGAFGAVVAALFEFAREVGGVAAALAPALLEVLVVGVEGGGCGSCATVVGGGAALEVGGDGATVVRAVHAVAAILFFACLAYVSVFRAGDTLSLVRDTSRAQMLQRVYRGLGIVMVASPLVALAAERVLRPPGGEPSVVFFVEARRHELEFDAA